MTFLSNQYKGQVVGKANLKFYFIFFLKYLARVDNPECIFFAMIVFWQVIAFDGGEYVSMAGEFNEFRKVVTQSRNYLSSFACCELSNFNVSCLFHFRFQMNSGTNWKQ